MINWEEQFYRWFLKELLARLKKLGPKSGATLTQEDVTLTLPWGQASTDGKIVRFTSRQANLLALPGEDINILTVDGIAFRGAVGDKKTRGPSTRPMGRGGGAFPRPPLPYQPVARDLAAWVSWYKYSVFGKYDELPGLLAIPHGPRLEVPPWFSGWDPNYDFEWDDFNPPRGMMPPEPEPVIEAREGVRYIYSSQWMNPESTEIPPWRMRRYGGKPMPMGLAYCMALVDGRLSIQSHPWTPWEGGDGIGYRREADAPANFLPVPRRAHGLDSLVVDELISPGEVSGSVTFEGGLYSPSGEKDGDGVYADLIPLFGSHTESFSSLYGLSPSPRVTESILSLMYDNSDQEVDRRFRYIPFQPEFAVESIRFLSHSEQRLGTASYIVNYEPGAKYGPAFYIPGNQFIAHPAVPDDVPTSESSNPLWAPLSEDFVGTTLYLNGSNPFADLVGSRIIWSAFLSGNLQSQSNPEAVVLSVDYGVTLYPGRFALRDSYDSNGLEPDPPTFNYLIASSTWSSVTFDRPVGVSKTFGANLGLPKIRSGDSYQTNEAARTTGEQTYQTRDSSGQEITATHVYTTSVEKQFVPGSGPQEYEILAQYGVTFRGAFMVYADAIGNEYSVYYEPGFEALTSMRANGGNSSQNRSAAPSGMDVLIRDEGTYSLINGSTQYSTDHSPVGTGSLALRSKMRDIPDLSDPFTIFTLGGSSSADRITDLNQKKKYFYFASGIGLQKRRKVTDPGDNHDGARPLNDLDTEATTYLMTQKNREIAAQTNPLLYRGEHGLLVNPFIIEGDQSPYNFFPEVGEDEFQALVQSWFGLTWPLGWYVADAAIIAMPEAETGNLVDRTVAAVIYPAPTNSRDELDDYLLTLSVDGVPLQQTWSVFDFFPGSLVINPNTEQVTARELFFLDGERWPDTQRVNVKPHYNFIHPAWPLRNTLWLEPFALRLRDLSKDKFGPADCIFTLFLDTVYVQD